MSSNYIQKSREIYNNPSLEYESYYFAEKTGGFVLIHKNHQTTPSERFVAEILASQGKRVKLLDISRKYSYRLVVRALALIPRTIGEVY